MVPANIIAFNSAKKWLSQRIHPISCQWLSSAGQSSLDPCRIEMLLRKCPIVFAITDTFRAQASTLSKAKKPSTKPAGNFGSKESKSSASAAGHIATSALIPKAVAPVANIPSLSALLRDKKETNSAESGVSNKFNVAAKEEKPNDAIKEAALCRLELPEAFKSLRLSKGLTDPSVLFNGHYHIIRANALDQTLELLNTSSRVKIEGARGSGKSFLLLQLALILRHRKVAEYSIYLPDGADWTTGRYAYYQNTDSSKDSRSSAEEPSSTNSSSPSSTNSTSPSSTSSSSSSTSSSSPSVDYIQPELALSILKSFAAQNELHLATDADLTWFPEALAEAAADPFNHAVKLLDRLFSSFTASKPKRLALLIDGANDLLDLNLKTRYNDPQGKALTLSALPVAAKPLLAASDPDSNILFIASTTRSNPLVNTDLSNSPHADRFKTLQLPNYTLAEMKACFELYRQLGHGPSGGLTEEHAKFKAFVSGRNPRILFKTCQMDAIYAQ